MAEAGAAAPVFVLHNTFGAAFIGMVVGATLHGVSCVQAFYYYTHQRDTWPIKSVVTAVMVFDTVHQALITHTVYTYVVTNWGNPLILGQLTWSLIIEVLFNGLTALLVQSFLTMRIWTLSNKSIILTGLSGLLVISEFICVVVFTGIAIGYDTFLELGQLETLSRVVNALAAAGDVLIAAALCIILHRSRTGFHRSDTIINKLIMFAVNTGALTRCASFLIWITHAGVGLTDVSTVRSMSVCALCSLIAITVAGDTFIYISFFFCMGRLYTNSLLATLNARKMIRGSADPSQDRSDFSYSLRKVPKNGTVETMPSKSNPHQNISIKIDTKQELAMDHDDSSVMGHDGPEKMPNAASGWLDTDKKPSDYGAMGGRAV